MTKDIMTKKVGFRMNAMLEDWYVKKAAEMGIPKSALMVFALEQYATQVRTVDMFEDIKNLKDLCEINNSDDLKNKVSEIDLKFKALSGGGF